jgi:hypothetical protein
MQIESFANVKLKRQFIDILAQIRLRHNPWSRDVLVKVREPSQAHNSGD